MRNFILYSCCVPVKGSNRSLICDIQRDNFLLIPNALYDIIDKYEGKTLVYIKSKYKEEDHKTIDEYFQLLEQKELIFWVDGENEIQKFPKLSLDYKLPQTISNAIIDIQASSNYDYRRVAEQLEKLGCGAVQLRCYDDVSLSVIKDFLSCFEYSRIRHIDVLLKYNPEITIDTIKETFYAFSRVNSIMLHSATHEAKDDAIIITKETFNSCLQCGVVSKFYFTINNDLFLESQSFNTCLHKKISVDVDGNIKNCPSMKESFGNIKETTLQEALERKDFKKHWNITKDQIDVCKDCEFRHICTDCRAYKEDPNNEYSKPLKCGYDPYTNVWEEWSTNPLKQKAIAYYEMQGVAL